MRVHNVMRQYCTSFGSTPDLCPSLNVQLVCIPEGVQLGLGSAVYTRKRPLFFPLSIRLN